MRVRYTARRKRGLVATAKRMMAEGKTLRAAADELRVSHANLSKWASQGMGEIDRVDKILRSKKKAALTGPSCVKRFMHAHSFSYRMGTHTSQRPPAEVESEAADFMRFMRGIVSGGNRDRRFIINMDQTPVFFSMSSKRTLEVIGKKTIHIRTSTNDTKRVTVAVTITADGTLLPSFLVFKGKPGGRIATKEFPSGVYPDGHFYKGAWCGGAAHPRWMHFSLPACGCRL